MTQLSQEFMAQTRTKSVWPICGDAVEFHWELIWQHLRELPDFLRLYTESYCFEKVKMGHWQVWAYSGSEIYGIVVTKISVFPKCKVLDVMTMIGTEGLEFMQELDDCFEMLAQQNGCAYISQCVRPGLERVLTRKHRAQKLYSVVTRPVGMLRSS